MFYYKKNRIKESYYFCFLEFLEVPSIGFYSDLRLFTGFSFDATAVRFHGIDAPFRVII